jgi:undecaprenyl-diphosphatase
MKQNAKKSFYVGALFSVLFLLWTLTVKTVLVEEIGPLGSEVGLAPLNGAFRRAVGVNMTLYNITDWLGLVPVFLAVCFAFVGLIQLIGRRSLLQVDRDILITGGFYIAVVSFYILFEFVVINYRPVLIKGILEVSYPSSTTLLVTTVMPGAAILLKRRLKGTLKKRFILSGIGVFTIFMVLGRIISGVHWISDIIGGLLLSASLLGFYTAALNSES